MGVGMGVGSGVGVGIGVGSGVGSIICFVADRQPEDAVKATRKSITVRNTRAATIILFSQSVPTLSGVGDTSYTFSPSGSIVCDHPW